MFADDTDGADRAAPRSRANWLAWGVATFGLLFVLGYFVVKPLAERAISGALALLAGMLVAAGAAAQIPFDIACHRVEQSDEAQSLVGVPIQCAPFEESQWLASGDRQELEFTFKFSGPKGTGQAHVVAVRTNTAIEIKSIDVTGPTDDVTTLLAP